MKDGVMGFLSTLRELALASLVQEAARRFSRHDMPTYASALAFNVLFSIFPFVILLMALTTVLDLNWLYDSRQPAAPDLLPPYAMRLLMGAVRQLRPPHGGLLSSSAVAALWLAARSMRALMRALNVVYEASTPRPAWKHYLLSLAYTLAIAVMLAVASVLMAVGPATLQWLARQAGLERLFVIAWTWLHWPLALALLASAVAIAYYAAPNVEHKFRFITAGSALSVVVWVAASAGLRFYVTDVALYNRTYGAVGAIIFLMLYFYASSAVLLFGAEINAVLEERRHQIAH
jgi:membrane protein